MARKPKLSKSAEIRKYKSQHADAKPAEIVKALAKRRIMVTNAQVSTALYVARRRRENPPGKSGKQNASAPGSLNVDGLSAAIDLIQVCGSPEVAMETLRAAVKLSDKLHR